MNKVVFHFIQFITICVFIYHYCLGILLPVWQAQLVNELAALAVCPHVCSLVHARAKGPRI